MFSSVQALSDNQPSPASSATSPSNAASIALQAISPMVAPAAKVNPLEPMNAPVMQPTVPQPPQRSSLLTFLYSNLPNILPEPIIGLIQKYYVAPKEAAEFLKLVSEGEQDQAEAMLKRNPVLALAPTDVTDLSKRTFKNITALQYALWALDWHMWMMLLKYIPEEAVTEQIAQSEHGLWVPQYGVTADWENLIQALKQYASEVRSNKTSSVCNQIWIKQVGGAQLLLPAHVINEYCRRTRSFHLTPDFSQPEATGAWRCRATDKGEWFSAKHRGGALGEAFAVCRGSNDCAARTDGETTTIRPARRRNGPAYAERDSAVLAALLKIRASQRAAVVAQYSPKEEFARRLP